MSAGYMSQLLTYAPFFLNYDLWDYTEKVVRPFLDNGLKGGNSESPERASLCDQSGVCMGASLLGQLTVRPINR